MAKSDKERKADQRKRRTQYLIDVGAKDIPFTAYWKTLENLEFLKTLNGIEENGDIIDRLINNAAEIIKRDMSQNEKLLKIPSSSKQNIAAYAAYWVRA